MDIMKSGRYSYDFHSEAGAVQLFTMRPDSTRSRFLTAQEALDLLRYLQRHEAQIVAKVSEQKVSER